MSNKLPQDWNMLVKLAKNKAYHICFEEDHKAILAADELIKEHQAHIERLREAGNKLHDWFGCGNTPDAVELAYEWEEIERETPAQSLEAVKREWHEQLIKESEVMQKEILDKCMSVRSSLDSTEDSPLEKIIKIGETLGVFKEHNND